MAVVVLVGSDGWLSGGCENARGRRENNQRERGEQGGGLVRVSWRLEKGRGRRGSKQGGGHGDCSRVDMPLPTGRG